MAEQVIVKKEEEESKKEIVVEPPPKACNYASGNKWKCAFCRISNSMSTFNCVACFASMNESMRKERSIIRKAENKARREQVKLERQRKREELAKKKEAGAGAEEDEKEQKSEEATESEKVEKPSKPLYKLSDGVPKTMRALVSDKNGFLLKSEYKVPTPKEDELLIRSFAVSISREDSVVAKGAKAAYIPGAECCGLVVGMGKDCRFRMGDRVVITNVYDDDEEESFGHGRGTVMGGCCDYYVAKEKYCYRLKRDINWTRATMLEKLSFAYNACERTDLMQTGNAEKETLVVSGCGVVGCLVIAIAKTMSVTGKVIAFDVDDANLAIAQKMGADEVFNVKKLKGSLKEKVLSLTDGVGAGRAIECSANSSLMSQIFGCVRKGARVTLAAAPSDKLVIDDVFGDVIAKNIQIRSVYGRRTFKTWNKAERMISDKKIDFDAIVSQSLAIGDWKKGFDATASGKALKVVFDLTK